MANLLERLLDCICVAAPVETQAQCDFLVESGCTTMQGYLLSRPVTGQVIADLMRGGRPCAIGERDAASLEMQ